MTTIPCYICNHKTFRPILKTKPSMSSDGQTVDLIISKEECSNCGTVRSTDTSFLPNFYKNYYKLNATNNDPQYIYKGEIVAKSKMHFEWIEKLVGNELQGIKSIIEIGCGSGNLLDLFNIKNKYGVEPGTEAAKHAAAVAKVRNMSYEDIAAEEKYDLILSTCVIEHTVDPVGFLKKIWTIAQENSLIVIGLPLQDTEGFDVYFLDHLHHFTSKQFIYLCQKNGFTMEKFEIGYKCITTIGYFVLRKKNSRINLLVYEKNKNFHTSEVWIANINNFLHTHTSKNIVAFGYGETSFFYQTYTSLKSSVTVFIDDVKAKTAENVISVADAINSGLLNGSILVLLVNPHYHNFIKKKFETVPALKYYSPFSNTLS